MIRFNNISASDYGITVKNIQRDVLPSFNNISYSLRGGDGNRFVKRTLDSREVRIELNLKNAKTLEELQDKVKVISEWFNVEQPCKLEFDDMPNRYLMAMPNGTVDLSQTYTYGVVSINLIAFDPYYYSVDATQLTLSDTGFVYNIGTSPCSWDLTLKFNKSIKRPEVQLGNSYIRFNNNVQASDFITLNSDGVFTINGEKNFNIVSYLSKIKQLATGESTYSFPDGVTATLTFRNKFIR